MNVSELYDQFRSDVFDTAKPYFWSDADVYRYMNDAYKMFVRLTGGIADFTSTLTQIDVVAGENIGTYDKRILRIMDAARVSDNGPVKIVNRTDIDSMFKSDYGITKPIWTDKTPGKVRYMVIGAQRGTCQFVSIPDANDTIQLSVYRLPKQIITEDIDPEFDFDEIGEEHVTHLSLWMRRNAFLKADADTFNLGKSQDYEQKFNDYCHLAKSEVEREKHKTRIVSYGGL